MPNLITNPGFETGTFSGWSVTAVTGDLTRVGITNGTGANNPLGVTNTGVYSPAVYEGNYSAYSGSPDFPRFRQTLATSNGASYDLSFWIGAHSTKAFIQVLWGSFVVFQMNNPGTNPNFWPTTPLDKFDSPSGTKAGVTGTLSSNGCTQCALGGLVATSTAQDVTVFLGECVDLWFFDLADVESQPVCPNNAGPNAQLVGWIRSTVICPPTLGVTFGLTPAGAAIDLYCGTTPRTLIITE